MRKKGDVGETWRRYTDERVLNGASEQLGEKQKSPDLSAVGMNVLFGWYCPI
jgi:hypothetical protein